MYQILHVLGINIPDHAALYESLYKLLYFQVTPHIATLYGRECKNVKSAIERMVSQFINVVCILFQLFCSFYFYITHNKNA